jgi:hypothetical protein
MTIGMLRPLSIGEVLDTSAGLYRRKFAQLMTVALITQAIPLLWSIYYTIRIQSGTVFGLSSFPLFIISALLSIALGSLGTATSTFIVAESYLGREISTGEAFSRALPFLGKIVSLAMLTSLLAALGSLLLLVPGIIIFCGLLVATPALVLESPQGGATAAMGRSWSLTKGFRWRIFVVLLVGILLIMIPSIALAALLGQPVGTDVAEVLMSPRYLLQLVLQSLLQLMVYPLLYIATTVLYYDLRVRKEAFDLEMLASAMHA